MAGSVRDVYFATVSLLYRRVTLPISTNPGCAKMGRDLPRLVCACEAVSTVVVVA